MATEKKRGLGRGLEELIRDTRISVPISADERTREETANGNAIIYLPIDDIKPNSMQPRVNFDEAGIVSLSESIERHGVLQPIIVRKAKNGYELVAGERRWRATKKSGLSKIPAIIRDLTEEENALFAIIENMQREDLNPIEEASAYKKIIDTYGMTQEEVARNVGESRPYVANTLSLLKLPAVIKNMIEEGSLSRGHANVIKSIKDKEKQIKIAKQVVLEGMSVRSLESHPAILEKRKENAEKGKKKRIRNEKSEELRSIEDELTSIFGTKVTLSFDGKAGDIKIHFYSKDELDGLIDDIRAKNM